VEEGGDVSLFGWRRLRKGEVLERVGGHPPTPELRTTLPVRIEDAIPVPHLKQIQQIGLTTCCTVTDRKHSIVWTCDAAHGSQIHVPGEQIHVVHHEITDFHDLILGVVHRELALVAFYVLDLKPLLSDGKHVVSKLASDPFLNLAEPPNAS